MSVVLDLDYVVVYDAGDYYVVEDKVLSKLPVVSRAYTKTFYRMEFDVVELEDGTRAFCRWYFPKEIPKQVVLGVAQKVNEMWVKKIREAEELSKLLGQAQQAAQPAEQVSGEAGVSEEVSVSELEEALKRIREYLRGL